MIAQMQNLPYNLVGFKAKGEVTEEDFKNVVMPKVNDFVERSGKLNYILVLDTPVKNFTLGAWIKDALMGLKHLTKWNRAAIVSDSEGIKAFTNVFSKLIPGEFKAFTHKDQDKAIRWASEQ